MGRKQAVQVQQIRLMHRAMVPVTSSLLCWTCVAASCLSRRTKKNWACLTSCLRFHIAWQSVCVTRDTLYASCPVARSDSNLHTWFLGHLRAIASGSKRCGGTKAPCRVQPSASGLFNRHVLGQNTLV